MKRPATKIVAVALAGGAAMVGVAGARRAARDAPCGSGFVREGPHCTVPPSATCPSPLVRGELGCVAPETSIVDIPETRVIVGSSDWEAEGRVSPRALHTAAFRIDRLEVARGRFAPGAPDALRATSHVTRAEARAFCRARGGRLPSEDEWIVAAAGDRPRRYPWGDTGAVCRRAAWGLVRGPCATGAEGPDTVGSHPDGTTPLGVHDLAGNVAEWVDTDGQDGKGIVRGGSYDTDLATELRTWVRREVPPETRDARIGFRCAYAALR